MKQVRLSTTHNTAVSFLLALSLMLLLIFPAHMHFHHETDSHSGEVSSPHQHRIELGLLEEPTDLEHEEEDHVLDVSKEVMGRNSIDKSSPVWLAILFLSGLFLVYRRVTCRPFEFSSFHFQQYLWLSPPLRAPPG
jgi:hypothetical protein